MKKERILLNKSLKKISLVIVMIVGVFIGNILLTNNHEAVAKEITQRVENQQSDLETMATAKVVAIGEAEKQAQKQAIAEQQVHVQEQAMRAAETLTEPNTTETEQQLQVKSESNEEQLETEVVVPTLSFVDAGHVTVNQGCSGFFINPNEIVTASHCALSSSSIQLIATGESFYATVSQNVPGKDFAILTVDHPNTQATHLYKRAAIAGENVTIYSRLNGAVSAIIVTQEIGTVTVLGNGSTQLNVGDNSLESTINAVNAGVSFGDSGSIVIGSDGAYLGVVAGSDGAMTYFVS